jgi:hypothetical protein
VRLLTEGYLLTRTWGEVESKEREACDHGTGKDEVKPVIEGTSADMEGEGDIIIRFRAAFILERIEHCGVVCKKSAPQNMMRRAWKWMRAWGVRGQ